MRFALAPVLLIIVMAVAACASSSLYSTASASNDRLGAQGLPFRWSVETTSDGGEAMIMHMLPLPVGQTRADEHTTGEILGAILRKEQGKGRPSAQLKEVRQMPDGREVWILQSPYDGIAYVVTLGSANQGVARIGLLGPYTYAQ